MLCFGKTHPITKKYELALHRIYLFLHTCRLLTQRHYSNNFQVVIQTSIIVAIKRVTLNAKTNFVTHSTVPVYTDVRI